MTVYAIAIGKGGTGKTTTSAALVHELARRGRRVLAVDLDRQGNLSRLLGYAPDSDVEVPGVTYDVLAGETPLAEAVVPALTVEATDVLIGTADLGALTPHDVPDLATALRDELRLAGGRWDDVVIDTPPSLSALTLAGLAAAEVIIAVCATDSLSVEQADQLRDYIAGQVARRLNRAAEVSWVIPTMHAATAGASRRALDELHAMFGDRVTLPVRYAQTVRSSIEAGRPVTAYRPRSLVAGDYVAAFEVILGSAS